MGDWCKICDLKSEVEGFMVLFGGGSWEKNNFVLKEIFWIILVKMYRLFNLILIYSGEGFERFFLTVGDQKYSVL